MSIAKSNKTATYSVQEAADFCGVVNQTVISWIRGKQLKASAGANGEYAVSAGELLKFMRGQGMRIPQEVLEACGEQVEADVPRSLLIVDDDQALNTVMMQFLKKRYVDMQIYQAFSGFEAGSQMVLKQPRCVILDLNLPGADGIKLCRYIRQSDAFGKPHIIVVTAMDDPKTEEECLALGVSRFFRKPVDLPTLADALQHLA